MTRYLGVIPARGGSKRLPGKNLILLGGKPLLSYTFEAARGARRLTHVVLSTDIEPIAEYGRSQGIDPQGLRPADMAGDRSPVTAALIDALAKFERHAARVDGIVLLQPTSPFRVGRHIDEAITLFESSGADTVTSVRASKEHPFWTWREAGDRLSPYYSMNEINLDRSALPPAFVENGAVYVVRRSVLEGGGIYGQKVVGYPMEDLASIDIDTPSDLQWAEYMLGRRPLTSPSMQRRILAVTGSRAEYGSMRPVLRALAAHPALALELLVTGMHLTPQFAASRSEIESDAFCPLHTVDPGDDQADMALALGAQILAMVPVLARTNPDVVLVQGDRGEMLAASIAAVHRNTVVAHMSGGDRTGSIDDSIRNAITSFAHVHLTTCSASSERLVARGEAPQRVFEVGEPVLDAIRTLDAVAPADLASRFGLDLSRPVVLATQHPVTTEAAEAATQVTATLRALEALGLQTVVTYPNTDTGGDAIVKVLDAWRGRDFLRVVPHLGQRVYLSLMKIAAVMVGNSSSGILEAASFQLPVVNIGTRQHGRLRAANVVEADYDAADIERKIVYALNDGVFRQSLRAVTNPYGDGDTARKTSELLARLRISLALLAKWLEPPASFVD